MYKIDVYEFLEVIIQNRVKASKLLKDNPDLLCAKTQTGETALSYLVIENYINEVKWLIKKGANINTKDNFGDTPLIYTVQLGHMKMAKLLINHNVQVNCRNNIGETPIFIAAKAGNVKFVDTLLSAGADPLISDSHQSIFDVIPFEKREQLLGILRVYGYTSKPN